MENYRLERAEKICSDLQELMVVQSHPITKWKIKKGFFLTPEEAEASSQSWQEFDSEKDIWSGPDEHYWFQAEVVIPQSFDQKSLWLSFVTQTTFWDAVNPQFLLFINKELKQGLDTNHREINYTASAKAGEKLIIDLQAYTGRDNDHNHGTTDHLRLMANLLEIDAEISGLHYDLSIPNKIVSRLPKDHISRIKLQLAIEKAINLLDLRVPYSREFYESVAECTKFVANEIYQKLSGEDEVIATCIGHTHIDVAWWWTVEQTKEKVVRSFTTVLKLMEEFPEYKFMSSQPQIYQFLKERYPALFEKIKERVKEGRWEAEGGMWLEADCNVTSGESLVRQFLHGKKFFKEEFGKENVILWLPDVFGYSAALPQIMKKSGIKYFMTTKIAWNQFNKLPMDTFWWKGLDGSEVFTHLITTQDINQPEGSFYTTYNGNLNPISVMRAWERYQQKDINNDVLICYGYGDGGGGPTREMLECGIRMQAGITGAPKVRMDTARNYFDELYEQAASNKNLPRWVGELYLEYHRGTYTTMARNKRANRKCELLWQDVEFYSVYAEKLGLPYDADEIYSAWETILLNQFHDILPGSSIHEVYEVTKVEYDRLLKRGSQILEEKISALADASGAKTGDIVLFNSLSFERNDSVVLQGTDLADAASLIDEDGNRLPLQKNADGTVLFEPKKVTAKGFSLFTPSKESALSNQGFLLSDKEVDTPYYHIVLDQYGQFISIFDKEADRELLKKGEKGNVLRVYEDKPIYYDNWDIDIYYKQKSWVIENAECMEWIEKGPVRATLKICRNFLQSKIIQKISFYQNSRRIDFDTYVDWKQHQLLLKAEFDVDINVNEAAYDIQFGSIKRPTHENTSWDAAKFEVCGHKWADLSEGNYGVSLLNDCKYGYGITEGKMTLSLVKSGILPNPVTDQEEHWFVYSLYPHMGDYNQANVQKEAYCLNIPVRSALAKNPKNILSKSLFSTSCDNVIVETVKEAEDKSGIIIRMYENHNCRNDCSIVWNKQFDSVFECDLMENEQEKIAEQKSEFSFEIRPFEIKTFKIVE